MVDDDVDGSSVSPLHLGLVEECMEEGEQSPGQDPPHRMDCVICFPQGERDTLC